MWCSFDCNSSQIITEILIQFIQLRFVTNVFGHTFIVAKLVD